MALTPVLILAAAICVGSRDRNASTAFTDERFSKYVIPSWTYPIIDHVYKFHLLNHESNIVYVAKGSLGFIYVEHTSLQSDSIATHHFVHDVSRDFEMAIMCLCYVTIVIDVYWYGMHGFVSC